MYVNRVCRYEWHLGTHYGSPMEGQTNVLGVSKWPLGLREGPLRESGPFLLCLVSLFEVRKPNSLKL